MDEVAEAVYEADPSSARAARGFVSATSRDWGFDPGELPLVTSELVSNALVHAGTAVRLRLHRLPGGVRLEVSDRHPGHRPPGAAADPRLGVRVRGEAATANGNGLVLVGALARDWGVRAEDGEWAKTVWAELGLDRG